MNEGGAGGRAGVQNQKDARHNSVQKHLLASPPSFFLSPFVKKTLFPQIVLWYPVLLKTCCNPCWKCPFRVVCLEFRVVNQRSVPCSKHACWRAVLCYVHLCCTSGSEPGPRARAPGSEHQVPGPGPWASRPGPEGRGPGPGPAALGPGPGAISPHHITSTSRRIASVPRALLM